MWLEVEKLSKSFGAVEAARDVSFSLGRAEIVAIVGDNGAGKSTLLKMIGGALHPDRGQLLIDGVPVQLAKPGDARKYGIEVVYQDLALVPELDVTTNVFLGRELSYRIGRFSTEVNNRKQMVVQARRKLEQLGIKLPSLRGVPVKSLSGGQRQMVAIARAVMWTSRLILMDEPTAALGVSQSEAVLDLVKRAKQEGTSVVMVSHILPHVIQLADRVLVMRHGRLIASLEPQEMTQERLISLIVGYEEGNLVSAAPLNA